MDRLSSISSESELTDLLGSLSQKEREELSAGCIDLCIAANCAGYIDATTSTYLESIAQERLSFGLNTPVKGARCLGGLVVLTHLYPSSSSTSSSTSESPSSTSSSSSLLLHYRFLLTWQLILREPSQEIKERIEAIIPLISSHSLSTKERVTVQLELFHVYMRYYEREKASESLTTALALSGLEVQLTGRMGKRTRYQEKELAQLVLDLNPSMAFGALSPEEEDCDKEKDVPVDVANQDDTLLQTVSLSDTPSTPPSPLTSLHLALVLATAIHERQTEHNEELLLEKCDAYLREIIARRRCWSVQCAALTLRSLFERKSKRRVERACQQMEHIVHLQMAVEPSIRDPPTLLSRCSLALATGLAPEWKSKATHAEILISLGCISEALLLYESMEDWDQVVECYRRMQQLEKAESILRRLLEERGEDADILCSIGDITNKREYYDRAIECSSDRSSRARRSLGMLFLHERRHSEAYDHFKRSLELQPIQLGVWFNAGHCAWTTERYQEAVSAYHRCVSLEPEHFEAWNNLAAAYIRMGQKERAARILYEALKFNYEHANVWENYLLLCVDTSNTRSALLALDRLADLKKKMDDNEVIEAIVDQILNEKDEVSRRELRMTAFKTLGHLAAAQPLSGRQWRAYAKLRAVMKVEGEDDGEESEEAKKERAENADKYTTLMEKALAAFLNVQNWCKSEDASMRVLEAAVELARHRIETAERTGVESARNTARVRVRMSLRQIVTLLDKHEEVDQLTDTVKTGLSEAKELLATVA